MPRPPQSLRHRRARWLASLLLAGLPQAAHAAVFTPAAKADPPTGEVIAPEPNGSEPLSGGGIQWRFAPWRMSGAVAVDLRWLRQEDGTRTSTALQLTDIDFASYLWQPWFAQVRLGLGWVASRSSASGGNGSDANDGGTGIALTGRAALAVFPASRFPFELRADVSDSRSAGVSLAGDHRTLRLALSQGWRPGRGNDQLQFLVDHSTIDSGDVKDRLTTFTATATRHLPEHQFEGGVTWSDHRRSDSDDHTQLATVRLRHGFNPTPDVQIESLANWNTAKFDVGGITLGSDTRQLSAFGTWRLPPGALFGNGAAPLVIGSARWVQVRSIGSPIVGDTFTATAGLSHEFGAAWRASASGTATTTRTTNQPARDSASLGATLAWSPPALPLAGWRWTPNASVNTSLAGDSQRGARQLVGVQGGHALSRDWAIGEQSFVTFAVTQSAATLHESGGDALRSGRTQAIAHGASVGWQTTSSGGSQSYAALSASQSITRGVADGRFDLVNLQWNQRVPMTRYSGFSANATAQATRNEASDVDPFTGQKRQLAAGWQPFYSAALSYDHQRFLDVPRLRLALLLSASSQQIERRALGDIDAPRERITESLEARLDWSVGRLETRLAARVARVDARTVAALQARAQRRF